ncbi:unnamed protein product [Calypogeia fissa]
MDEWRRVESFGETKGVFLAGGKFHRITPELTIYVYDIEMKCWTCLHRGSLAVLKSIEDGIDNVEVEPLDNVAVNDELLVKVLWPEAVDQESGGVCRLQSKGFGSESEEIAWEKEMSRGQFTNVIDYRSLTEL